MSVAIHPGFSRTDAALRLVTPTLRGLWKTCGDTGKQAGENPGGILWMSCDQKKLRLTGLFFLHSPTRQLVWALGSRGTQFTAFGSQKPSRRCGSERGGHDRASAREGPRLAGSSFEAGESPVTGPRCIEVRRRLRAMSRRRFTHRFAGARRVRSSGSSHVGGGRHLVGGRPSLAGGGRPGPARTMPRSTQPR